MTIDIFLPCNPPKSTHQGSLRIMKKADGTQFVGKFSDSRGRETMNMLMTLLAPHRPAAAMRGPLRVTVVWAYPWRKSERKAIVARRVFPCDTRPDCDNLAKMLFDAMTRLNFWTDDSQISGLRFSKIWSDTPGIGIKVEELTEFLEGVTP